MQDTTPTAAEEIQQVLDGLDQALAAGDVDRALELFQDNCYWRDFVAFTWNLITLEGKGLPFGHEGPSLLRAGTWNLTTRAGDLDISITPDGTQGFADLVRDAIQVEAFGVVIPIASLADVIRSKQAANRPKDQRVLPTLREILGRRPI